MYVYVCLSICIYTHTCVGICMCVCMHEHVNVCWNRWSSLAKVCVHVSLCVYMCAWILHFIFVLFSLAHKELTNSHPLAWPVRGPWAREKLSLFSNCPAAIGLSQFTRSKQLLAMEWQERVKFPEAISFWPPDSKRVTRSASISPTLYPTSALPGLVLGDEHFQEVSQLSPFR
jgi:hypothetical protein